MEQTRQLLDAGATARLFRVPVRWLKGEADAGRLPHIRAERAYLFDPVAVEAVLLERAGRPQADADGEGGQR